MSQLKVEIESRQETVAVFLAGAIDENSNYKKIPTFGYDIYDIDFKKVTLINSLGIQGWIRYFKEIPLAAKFRFFNCPVIVVNLLNVFPEVTEGRKVTIMSAMAPFFCEACDEDHDVLLKKGDGLPDNTLGTVPTAPCPECGGDMDFDEVPKVYFTFVNR